MSDEPTEILGPEPDDEQLADTTRSLGGARPVPSPAFRGELGRLLGIARLIPPVAHWRAKAVGVAVAGALLLGAVGAGVAGSGPLAPSRVTSASASSTPSAR
ncbi:MAG: hypothetical protein ACTHM1_08000 [Solirubrobacteraceae bacterium]